MRIVFLLRATLAVTAMRIVDGFAVAGVLPHCSPTASIVMQHGGKGFGGGEATRDPEPTDYDPSDPKGKQQAIHKAESFAEYLAKRGTASESPAAVPAPAAAAIADVATRISAAQSAALQCLVSANNMYASPPIEVPLDSGAVARVTPFIPEEPKRDSIELGLEASRALATERQAAAPKGEVSWCSSLDAGDHFSLTAWNSPQVYVPHLYWSAAVVDGGSSLALAVDFRPRAEAGYETRLPDGSYPEPTDRQMFMQGSTRKELADAFFTPEAEEWSTTLRTAAGATSAPTPTIPQAPVAGPLLVDVVMPLTEAAVDAACAACEGAVARYLAWMAAAERLDQRRTMMVFAHDSKVRATCLAASTAALQARFGAEAGHTLALADSGPLDIADRGSAQNAAATTNFDASEKDQSVQDMMQVGLDQRGAHM